MRRAPIRPTRAIALGLLLPLALPAAGQEAAAVAPAVEAQANEGLPARLDVLRIGEERIGAAEFGEWLVRERGRSMAPNYALRLLIEREAAKLDIALTPEELAGMADEEIRVRVQNAFSGVREDWVAELTASGLTEDGYRTQRIEELGLEAVRDRLVKALRVIDEPRIEREWERVYGPNGRSMKVLGILRRVEARSGEDRRTREDIKTGVEEEVANATAELSGIASELERGASFRVLARKLSDDEPSLERGATVTDLWTGKGWPAEATEQLLAMAPGGVTTPVRARGGVWVLYLDSATEHPLDEVRDDLLVRLENSPPDAADLTAVIGPLWETAKVVYQPALDRPDLSTLAGRAAPALTLDGVPVSLERFEGWLRRLLGEPLVSRFAVRRVTENAAAERELDLDEEAIGIRALQEREALLELEYKGSKEDWLDQLNLRNLSEEHWSAVARERARLDLLTERLIRLENPITEEHAYQLWLSRYGSEGRAVDVRMIRSRVQIEPKADDESMRQYDARKSAALQPIRQALEELVVRVEEGEDFGALARRHSDHDSAVLGGVPSGDFSVLGSFPEFSGPILGANLGDVVGPLLEDDAVYLFEVISTRELPFESVRDRLLEELDAQQIPRYESIAWRMRRLQQVGHEILPPMFR